MHKLVLLRHGESTWNKENRFTGWTDVDLTEQGRQEAKAAGQVLKKDGFSFDLAYCSVMKRALRTLWIVLDELDELIEISRLRAVPNSRFLLHRNVREFDPEIHKKEKRNYNPKNSTKNFNCSSSTQLTHDVRKQN